MSKTQKLASPHSPSWSAYKASFDAQVKAQRQPGGLGYQIEHRSRRAYEANQGLQKIIKPIARFSAPDGSFVEASKTKTDRFSCKTSINGRIVYIDQAQAIRTFEMNGRSIKYSSIALGPDSRKVFPDGYPNGVFVRKDVAAAQFDKNGRPKPPPQEIPTTRYRVVTGSQPYDFKTASKQSGVYKIGIRTSDGSQKFVTSHDYNLLRSNHCFNQQGRLIGYPI